MLYYRLCETLSDKGKLIPYTDELDNHIRKDVDYYRSLYLYNEDQKQEFERKGTISGITQVVTNNLVWDFDSKDLEVSKKDAVELVKRLIAKGISQEAIQIYFSGKKGFTVALSGDKLITVDQFRATTSKLAEGLVSNDRVIGNPSRIIRVPFTRHPETKAFKIPLKFIDLSGMAVSAIKEVAAIGKEAYEEVPKFQKVDLGIVAVNSVEKPKYEVAELNPMDFSRAPKGWSNCKYSLLSGNFNDGIRNQAVMAILATARGLNYPQVTAYYMAKSAVKASTDRTGAEEYPKESIWKAAEAVYSPNWNGGTYSCKDGKSPWLTSICDALGPHKCAAVANNSVVTTDQVFSLFQDYTQNYDKNALTSGIAALDERVKFMVGTSNGILAPPGVGKTSVSLGILNHNSKQGIPSIFYSLDVYHSMIYLRLLQRHTGLPQEDIFKVFRNDPVKSKQFHELIRREYEKVNFCFKSGITPDDIQQTIVDTQEKTGEKIKLIIIDYNELVISGASDPTQASAQVAQRLRQIANDLSVCVVTLLQPSKLYSNPAEEATTYQAAKGSGSIAQSLTLMLSLSRPGFNPRKPEQDRYLSINALKNRNGPLFAVDMYWDGLKGQVWDIDNEGEAELAQIRQVKEETKKKGEW
jgi:hypothetical protein